MRGRTPAKITTKTTTKTTTAPAVTKKVARPGLMSRMRRRRTTTKKAAPKKSAPPMTHEQRHEAQRTRVLTAAEIKHKFEHNSDTAIPFLVFYCTVLSRLAYFTGNHFLPAYLEIFGPIIPYKLLTNINKAEPTYNIFEPSIYNLDEPGNTIPTYSLNGKKYINFTKYAQEVNTVTGERSTKTSRPNYKAPTIKPVGGAGPATVINGSNYKVAYISIATYNYGGSYVLVDTRMPNTIFVIFRGTYSVKSAMSYSRPSSLFAQSRGLFSRVSKANQVASQQSGHTKLEDGAVIQSHDYSRLQDLKDLAKGLDPNNRVFFGALDGIRKIIKDNYNTILSSMAYLATTYLYPGKDAIPNSIKVVTTGHSLGGALTTLFANDWSEIIANPYYKDQSEFQVFKKEIVCVSIASPRVLGDAASQHFCAKTYGSGDGKEGPPEIIFKRIAVRNDPVASIPPTGQIPGRSAIYNHPCSSTIGGPQSDQTLYRQKVNLTIAPTLSNFSNTRLRAGEPALVNYQEPLQATNIRANESKIRPGKDLSTARCPRVRGIPQPCPIWLAANHMEYANINFSLVVDLWQFLRGVPRPTKSRTNSPPQEIEKIAGTLLKENSNRRNHNIGRIMEGVATITAGQPDLEFHNIFYDIEDVRSKDVKADDLMTYKVFNEIMEQKRVKQENELNQVTPDAISNITRSSVRVPVMDGIFGVPVSPTEVLPAEVPPAGGRSRRNRTKKTHRRKSQLKKKTKRRRRC